MRHWSMPVITLLCAATLLAPTVHAFDDDDDGDRVIYADSPKDRYEARLQMLENQADARRAQCRGNGIGGKSYCAQEIDKDLRIKKRELKDRYEAELAAAKAGQ